MKFIIDEQSEGLRLDLFIAEAMPDFSRSKIQKYIKGGKVFLNDTSVKSSYILREGDIIKLEIPEQSDPPIIIPENIPIDVIWENENMAVINKPSGMLTHPTTTETTGTLVNALLYKYGENLSDINGDMRRGILHRLDRCTSGLIMIAKNNYAHQDLVSKMKEKLFTKKYLAIVKGVLSEDNYTIDYPIGRNPRHPEKMAVSNNNIDVINPKEALSIINVKERLKDATYAEVQIITGRTHQIRVHFASIGHPVYNDTLYGFGKIKIKTDEQVLQSYKLEFIPPGIDKTVSLEIPPDDKIKKVLNYLKSNQNS